MVKDSVVARRTGTEGQQNCKAAVQGKCCIKQIPIFLSMYGRLSPIRLLKESFLLNKRSHGGGGRSSENQHFSSLHLQEISPVLYLQ